jgi:hypothetical protein
MPEFLLKLESVDVYTCPIDGILRDNTSMK